KGPDVTVLEDSGPQTFAGWASGISAGPEDEADQSVRFMVRNDNRGLFLVQPMVAPDGTLTFTPAANPNGTATVTIQLSDTGGTAFGGVDLSATASFTIALSAVNDRPSFRPGPNQIVSENSGPQSVPNWATRMAAGAADEVNQALGFFATVDKPELF